MKSSATVVVSSTVLLVLAAAACSSATEWSPEDIGNIASAAADSRELETLDVSEHLNRPRPSPTYNKAITLLFATVQRHREAHHLRQALWRPTGERHRARLLAVQAEEVGGK